MNFSKLNENDYKFFLIFSLFWALLGWLGFLLALLGFFYSWIILLFFLSGLAYLAMARRSTQARLQNCPASRRAADCQRQIRKPYFNSAYKKLSGEFIIVSLSAIIIVVIYSFFVTPTVFSGRDQGSISETAIRLSQNHKLQFSTPASEQFFKIYGPGKALDFPGFYYDNSGNLVSNFPLPYSAWLAVFYSFFGVSGLILANSVLLFLFLLSFYLLLRKFLPPLYAFSFLLITATTFPIFWFFKYTLTENMALFLLWFAILSLYIFSKEKDRLSFWCLLASAGLLFFTRIEGMAFFVTIAIAFILLNKTNFKEIKNILRNKLAWLLIFAALAIFILNFFKNIYFYKEIVKAVIFSGSIQKTNNPGAWSKLAGQYEIFALYGFILILIIGTVGIVYFLKKKNYYILIPLLIVLPTLLYLVDPLISSDYPWMLRRFSFSIIPCFIFYSAVFIGHMDKKMKFKYGKYSAAILVIIIFVFNLPVFFRYFPFSENENLLPQVENISQNFSDHDLILVDRLSSGDGWSMITGPMSALYGKNAAYLVNPTDVEKIDFKNFNHVFLIVPEAKIDYYKMALGDFTLQNYGQYELETTRLDSGGNNPFPSEENAATGITIFKIEK